MHNQLNTSRSEKFGFVTGLFSMGRRPEVIGEDVCSNRKKNNNGKVTRCHQAASVLPKRVVSCWYALRKYPFGIQDEVNLRALEENSFFSHKI